jgi:hypothetical protein
LSDFEAVAEKFDRTLITLTLIWRNMMTTIIKLPDGGLTCNEEMKVVFCSTNGVICRGLKNQLIAWIPVTDPVKAKKVLKLMSDFAKAGQEGVQPCWDFLLETPPEND